ncbi:MAG TPA: hypothetical protein VJ019_07410 [Aestuariivirga sp.]|jgi:hypothetical protein|nr:hypothetical protein [Aestuariivirga sp.]
MIARILFPIALLAAIVPAHAEETSPYFGSATQEPMQIAIDPATGLPMVAEMEQPQAVVAAKE